VNVLRHDPSHRFGKLAVHLDDFLAERAEVLLDPAGEGLVLGV
jgi:hypothetical protein